MLADQLVDWYMKVEAWVQTLLVDHVQVAEKITQTKKWSQKRLETYAAKYSNDV